jgi:dTDP-4-dehydrorhamnose 3,5-epimerase
MKLIETPIADLLVIEPKVFGDERGFFLESFNEKTFQDAGLNTRWVQDNHSRSTKGVLRGLHFQNPHSQIKLVRVTQGEVYDVAVDLRPQSKSYGKHFGINLSAENKKWLYVPKGFAHGFLVLSDFADFLYKCSDFYSPENDGGLAWNDPDLKINWAIKNPIVSAKDQKLPLLKNLDIKEWK